MNNNSNKQPLDVNGYKLHPGFAQSSSKEKCSPLVHVSTVYEGDKNLKDILDEISEEKNKLPEITIFDVEIKPGDWTEQPDGTFKYDYINSYITEDMMTEVQADKDNMRLIINDKIRWILTEDVVGNTVPIYSQKRPSAKLYLLIIVYTKYIKIPLSMQEPNWLSGVAKEFKWNDDRILGSHLALFRLDRTNIAKFLNNNYSITSVNKGTVSVYTDNAVTLDSQVILLETDIKDTNNTGNGTIPPQTNKDDIVGDVLTYVQRCNITGDLYEYEINEGVVNAGVSDYVNALPNIQIFKSHNVIVTDTNNNFECLDTPWASVNTINGTNFKEPIHGGLSTSINNFAYVHSIFMDNYNNIAFVVSYTTPYSMSINGKITDDVYQIKAKSYRVIDPLNKYTPLSEIIDYGTYSTTFGSNKSGCFGFIKNNKSQYTGKFQDDKPVIGTMFMQHPAYLYNIAKYYNTSYTYYDNSGKGAMYSVKKGTDDYNKLQSIRPGIPLPLIGTEIMYILNPTNTSSLDDYLVENSKNKNMLSFTNNKYVEVCGLLDTDKFLGGYIKTKDLDFVVHAMQKGYIKIMKIHTEITSNKNESDIDSSSFIQSLPTNTIGQCIVGNNNIDCAAFELRTNLEFGYPSAFNIIAEKKLSYIGHNNGLLLVFDNEKLDVIYDLNITSILDQYTSSYSSKNRIKCIDWFDDNNVIVTCVDNPFVYCINVKNKTLSWAHDSGITEGPQAVTNLNQSVYFCYKNKESEIRFAEWKKLEKPNNNQKPEDSNTNGYETDNLLLGRARDEAKTVNHSVYTQMYRSKDDSRIRDFRVYEHNNKLYIGYIDEDNTLVLCISEINNNELNVIWTDSSVKNAAFWYFDAASELFKVLQFDDIKKVQYANISCSCYNITKIGSISNTQVMSFANLSQPLILQFTNSNEAYKNYGNCIYNHIVINGVSYVAIVGQEYTGSTMANVNIIIRDNTVLNKIKPNYPDNFGVGMCSFKYNDNIVITYCGTANVNGQPQQLIYAYKFSTTQGTVLCDTNVKKNDIIDSEYPTYACDDGLLFIQDSYTEDIMLRLDITPGNLIEIGLCRLSIESTIQAKEIITQDKCGIIDAVSKCNTIYQLNNKPYDICFTNASNRSYIYTNLMKVTKNAFTLRDAKFVRLNSFMSDIVNEFVSKGANIGEYTYKYLLHSSTHEDRIYCVAIEKDSQKMIVTYLTVANDNF